ncbi:helix-turn-helix domain-containing protein [Pseudarthrobacter sp. AG30]|uniref:helix-turn-helix domain-containing protein n=1 Tax=Pseudarthrobacter sp. AG30 TaxID=2249742 RepID=UPI000D6E8CF1|nr:XRE family transcriptional regulator [Pseudarthrobacter sp. AG30]RAX14918.1 helix-turn-helix domain-containing protein [Pseudarthrobacter sp. AG30]
MTEVDAAGQSLIALVGGTIKKLRTAQRVSVTDLAKRSDVSRRMLTAIEAGTANASLVTLDKVARALGVEFSALVRSRTDNPVEVIPEDEATVVWRGGGGSQGRVFTTTKSQGPAEMWDWTLAPGGHYDAEPDPQGSEEMLAVIRGTLSLDVDGETYVVPAGGVARIATDRTYSYRNDSSDEVSFVRIVVINTP